MNKKYEAPSLFIQIYQLLMKFPILQNIRLIFYIIDMILLLFDRKPKLDSTGKKRVLVVFPFALGDCVLFCGTAEYYRILYPISEYELSIVCQKANAELVEPYFDKVLSFQFTKASVDIGCRNAIYREIRKYYYDIVIDPFSCSDCTPNIFTVNATCGTQKIGFIESETKRYQCPEWIRNKIYSRVIPIDEANLHRLTYYYTVLQKLGLEGGEAHPMVFERIPLQFDLPDEYFIIFPTASLSVKKWPIERYAELAKRIYHKCNIPLVICGTEHDREDSGKLLAMISEVNCINIIGKTNVMQFAEVIGRAAFIVTNDTSAYHIAVAQMKKVFILAGGYVFDMFANYVYGKQGFIRPILIYKKRECFNCNNYCKYQITDVYPCLMDITIEDAWNIIEDKI